MKAYIIEKGHFSQAGNFIAFSTKGERIHIYKKDILRLFTKAGIVYRCQGRYENELITFPFYCMAEHLTFNSPDGTTFTRLTASQISEHEYEIKTVLFNSRIVSLEMDLHFCKQDYDKLQEEYDALVAKVEHFDANGELNECRMVIDHLSYQVENLEEDNKKLKDENERLKDDFNALQWENEYIQSERERLALVLINLRETLMSCNLGLSQDKINQLINNA